MGVANFLALPGREALFRDFATDPATRALAHVSRLDVGPTLAAANYGLVFRGRYYHVLASYDDGPVSRFGPGAAHLHELMRYAIEHGCREFDFTIGDEPYKRDWCDAELRLYDHRSAVTAARLAGGIALDRLHPRETRDQANAVSLAPVREGSRGSRPHAPARPAGSREGRRGRRVAAAGDRA